MLALKYIRSLVTPFFLLASILVFIFQACTDDTSGGGSDILQGEWTNGTTIYIKFDNGRVTVWTDEGSCYCKPVSSSDYDLVIEDREGDYAEGTITIDDNSEYYFETDGTQLYLSHDAGDDLGIDGVLDKENFSISSSDVCDDDVCTSVNPADPDAISAALIMPTNTTRFSGNAPPQSSGSATVSGGASTLTSSNGSTAILSFNFAGSSNLSGVYVQVSGASEHYRTSLAGGTSGTITYPIGLPANVSSGTFAVTYSVYDNLNRVSNTLTTNVQVLRLGSGALQISLSWTTTADVDLYVTDPNAETISYFHTSSVSGGQLDRDDTDGYGPENVFWDSAPNGVYQVSVNHYSGTVPTSYIVTVTAGATTQQFQGVLSADDETDVVTTFTKTGSTIIFGKVIPGGLSATVK